MEEGFDVVEAQCSKVATAIKRVGKVTSIKDVTSLMINVCTVMMVVSSSDSSKPLLDQAFTKIMTMTITMIGMSGWSNVGVLSPT